MTTSQTRLISFRSTKGVEGVVFGVLISSRACLEWGGRAGPDTRNLCASGGCPFPQLQTQEWEEWSWLASKAQCNLNLGQHLTEVVLLEEWIVQCSRRTMYVGVNWIHWDNLKWRNISSLVLGYYLYSWSLPRDHSNGARSTDFS